MAGAPLTQEGDARGLGQRQLSFGILLVIRLSHVYYSKGANPLHETLTVEDRNLFPTLHWTLPHILLLVQRIRWMAIQPLHYKDVQSLDCRVKFHPAANHQRAR